MVARRRRNEINSGAGSLPDRPESGSEAEIFDDPEFIAHFEDATFRSRLLASLLETRISTGLTQNTVAHLMGTTQSAISELEGGGTDPRLSTLQRYARAVGAMVYVDLLRPSGFPFAWNSISRLRYVMTIAEDFGVSTFPSWNAISSQFPTDSQPVHMSYVQVEPVAVGVHQLSEKS